MSGRRRLWDQLALRIIAPVLAVNLLVFGVLAFYLGRRAADEGLRELRQRGQLLADAISQNAELPMLAMDEESLAVLLETAGRSEEMIRACIRNAEGEEIVEFSPPATRTNSPAAGVITVIVEILTTPSTPGDIEASAFSLETQRASARSERIGQVQLEMSMAPTARRTEEVQRTIAAAWVALLLLGVIGAATIVRLVGRPLRALVHATRVAASGDLSVRQAPSSSDEIGELTQAFNSMIEDLESSRDALLEERADLERRVGERTAELERAQLGLIQSEKMSAVGQLVAGVAHELNNPLAVVIGYSTMLGSVSDDPATVKKVKAISEAAERARKIVQNLLTFARRQGAERGPVNVNPAIRNTAELRSYALKDAGIRCTFDLEPDLPPVLGDLQQLQQVFLNLLINAEQAIRSSRQGSKVTFSTRSAEGRVIIEVVDDGPSMSFDVLSRVFDPFFTTKDVGEGTGLGLSIVYGIVKDHDGEIQAESEPGRFTRFEISLPEHERARKQAEQRPEHGPVAREGSNGPRLLVIDDDPDVLSFISSALEIKNVEVVSALGGQSGIDHLSQGGEFDVVLSDIRMPEVDGRDIYSYLQRHRPELEDRIIFVTGDAINTESAAFLDQSGCAFLEKPFTIDVLWEAVSAKLDGGVTRP